MKIDDVVDSLKRIQSVVPDVELEYVTVGHTHVVVRISNQDDFTRLFKGLRVTQANEGWGMSTITAVIDGVRYTCLADSTREYVL